MFFKITTLFILFVITLLICPFKINLSSSMPIGLYWRESPTTYHRGDWVAVCLPSSIAIEGLRRGYLSKGLCSSGGMSVLKMIIAIPEDTVTVTPEAIIVNDKIYLAPHQTHDSSGYPVRDFIDDSCYRTSGYWLYGVGNILRSWDSRYYGGIDERQIIARYRLIAQI